MAKYSNNNLKEMLAITKALADENRIRIVLALRRRSLCVCQITALLKLAPSTVSKHVAILKQAGLVETRKEGRWIHCRIPKEELTTQAQEAIRLLTENLRTDKHIQDDHVLLTRILGIDKGILCRRS